MRRTDNGPRRNRLNTDAPRNVKPSIPHLKRDAPQTAPKILVWHEDEYGFWYNEDVCTDDEEEKDEIGNAEPSEEEDSRKQNQK